MSEKTIAKVSNIIFDALHKDKYYVSYEKCESISTRIYNELKPPLKSLSQLHKDEEAYKEIAKLFSVEVREISNFPIYQNLDIMGNYKEESALIIICFDGRISLSPNINNSVNYFEVIDKIRSLGYEPQK